jgi:5'-3' exonuclease
MKTLIIDSNNLIHRTFWTAKKQSQRTQTDTPEQLSNFHIYFTLNAIFSYTQKFQPTQVICVWDEKPDYRRNERKTLFTEYKGNRSNNITPHQNNEAIKKLLSCLGIKSIFPRELEADDVVAFLCDRLEGKKVIVSVDKDFLQLINSSTTLYDPIRQDEYNSTNFTEKTGWTDTHEWLDAKCLLGDKSDNVPGIHRFGKSKVKQFRKGEIKLTPEQFDIYKRNLSLFSLDAFYYRPDEEQYYTTQLDTPTNPDWKQFLEECNVREFKTFIQKKDTWHALFFMRGKLQSIFS